MHTGSGLGNSEGASLFPEKSMQSRYLQRERRSSLKADSVRGACIVTTSRACMQPRRARLLRHFLRMHTF